MAPGVCYDVAIIGGGVIGCAISHQLSSSGCRTVLLEKEDHLVSGASSGNSGICHYGYDSTPNTLEAECMREAYEINRLFYKRYDIPHKVCGGLMVAWSQKEVEKLADIVDRCHKKGMSDIKILSRSEVFEREPHLSRDALGAIWIPKECVIDPWLLPIVLAHLAIRKGAQIVTKCQVTGGRFNQQTSIWHLETSQGPINAHTCINAAGLYGDEVEAICHHSSFTIKPRKGQFIILSKEVSHLINSVILPVPNERTRGVLILPTVYGNIVVGPTADDVLEKTNNQQMDSETIELLYRHAKEIIPAVDRKNIVGSYAGLRPATQHLDYQMYADNDRNWVTVGGIRSTGLTACLAIAQWVASLELFRNFTPSTSPDSSRLTYMFTTKGTLVIDGCEYVITHPITKDGLMDEFKSKL